MLIDGKHIAQKMLEELKAHMTQFKRPPRLAAILVGDPLTNLWQGLRKFVEQKQKAAQQVGAEVKIYEFTGNISNSELREKINQILQAKTTTGALIELPLPIHLNTQYLLNTIPEHKDVDALSQKSQGAFFVGRSKILPPAVEAVKQIFQEYRIDLKGKTIVVFGYGLLVGRPISHWLLQQGATVCVVHEFTTNPSEFSRSADIIISGTGRTGLIRADMVKDGAVVIDFGFTATMENGKTIFQGDVVFDEVSKKASWITPVFGGVGPIVVASVIQNLVVLAGLQKSQGNSG